MTEPFVRADVRAFLDSGVADRMPPLDDRVLAAIRGMENMTASLDVDAGPIAVKRDIAAPGPAGPMAVRLYDAREQREPGPVMVYYHGGGFCLGSIALFEALAVEMARALDIPVLSVEYRLAPEHPFPAAPDDAESAARWIAGAPAELGIVPTGLVLAGDSAGGNLAIVTAMALRDQPAAVSTSLLFALYPALGRQQERASFDQFADGYMLNRQSMAYYDKAYAADRSHWRGRPMDGAAEGLPPSLIVTASLDPLRDEGRAFAGKLAAAGVPVTFLEAKGNIHGFATFRRAIPSSADDLAAALRTLRSMLAEMA